MLNLFQQETARLDNDKCTLYFYQFPYIRTTLITHLKFPNIIIVPTSLSLKKRGKIVFSKFVEKLYSFYQNFVHGEAIRTLAIYPIYLVSCKFVFHI